MICPDCPGFYDSTATTLLDDSGSTVYAGMDAARTSTPQAGCRKGSTRSLDALDALGAVGGAEATKVGSTDWTAWIDSLDDSRIESLISGLMDSILGSLTGQVAADVLDAVDTSTQTSSLDNSSLPLVAAEATPLRRSRALLPRAAKARTKGLYGDPSHPYRRYAK